MSGTRASREILSGVVWLALATVGLAAAAAMVLVYRVGRVVAVVDESAGMGVHAGDLLTVPVVAASIACLVLGLASVDRAARRSATPWR